MNKLLVEVDQASKTVSKERTEALAVEPERALYDFGGTFETLIYANEQEA